MSTAYKTALMRNKTLNWHLSNLVNRRFKTGYLSKIDFKRELD